MEIRLLGKVGVFANNEQIKLGTPKHCLLLAVLTDSADRPVHMDQLTEILWDGNPPREPVKGLHAYVSDLRKVLLEAGSGELRRETGGYQLVVARDLVDLHRFHDKLRAAQNTDGTDDANVARLAREALREWGPEWRRPEPLAGFTGHWVGAFQQRLRERYNSALIMCVGAEFRLGRHSHVLPELVEITEEWLANEQLAELLMIAYYRVGRQSDALGLFTRVRGHLDEELGATPGPALQKLHQRILRHDPDLATVSHPSFDALPLGGDRIGGERPHEDQDKRSTTINDIAKSTARLLTANAKKTISLTGGHDWRNPAVELVGRVRKQFTGDQTAEAALARVESSPDDSLAVHALRAVLVVHLRRDRPFEEDLERMVEAARTREKARGMSAIQAQSIKNAQVFNKEVKVQGDWNIF